MTKSIIATSAIITSLMITPQRARTASSSGEACKAANGSCQRTQVWQAQG